MRKSIGSVSMSRRFLYITILIVITYLLVGCSLLFSIDPDDDTGDNDDFDDATLISNSTNSWSGEISSSSDIDVFKKWFDTGWYYIDMTDLTDDLDIDLYNSNESYVNSSEESGVADERIHQSIVQGGYYYIVVYGFAGDESGYTITISRP